LVRPWKWPSWTVHVLKDQPHRTPSEVLHHGAYRLFDLVHLNESGVCLAGRACGHVHRHPATTIRQLLSKWVGVAKVEQGMAHSPKNVLPRGRDANAHPPHRNERRRS
jgi:hypothetical protein